MATVAQDAVPEAATAAPSRRRQRWRSALGLILTVASVVLLWQRSAPTPGQAEIYRPDIVATADHDAETGETSIQQQSSRAAARRAELTGILFGDVPITMAVKPALIAEYARLERERLSAVHTGYATSCASMVDLKSIDFSGLDLSGIDLTNTNLRHVVATRSLSLRNSDLTNTCLNGTLLRAADLTGARLDFSDCQVCDLGGVTFAMTSLKYAKLNFSNLHAVAFIGSDLLGTEMCGAWGVSAETLFLGKHQASIKTFTYRIQRYFPALLDDRTLENADAKRRALNNRARIVLGAPVQTTAARQADMRKASALYQRAITTHERIGENAIPAPDPDIFDQDSGQNCSY